MNAPAGQLRLELFDARDAAFLELVRPAMSGPWRCPACDRTEQHEQGIANNHGITRRYLRRLPDGEWVNDGAPYGRAWCLGLELIANHVAGGHVPHPRQRDVLGQPRPDVRAIFRDRVNQLARTHI
ncbi:hypothetical protein [Nocardia miyunensis]|uniref:hypothetical protein n=1 Tax=Nocardia miyunensis TaxID=282684 RepID=UPI00082DEBAF|nr:hypothetical protein [Nocardia miyunensis]